MAISKKSLSERAEKFGNKEYEEGSWINRFLRINVYDYFSACSYLMDDGTAEKRIFQSNAMSVFEQAKPFIADHHDGKGTMQNREWMVFSLVWANAVVSGSPYDEQYEGYGKEIEEREAAYRLLRYIFITPFEIMNEDRERKEVMEWAKKCWNNE